MHLVGYLYEDYHDARSLEHKVVLFYFETETAKFLFPQNFTRCCGYTHPLVESFVKQ
jgi:hypothetical protein